MLTYTKKKKQRINPSTQKFIDICNDIDSAHPPTPPKLTVRLFRLFFPQFAR